MRIPPLPRADRFVKRKYRITFNGSFDNFLVTIINPTNETVRALEALDLPLGVDFEIDYGDCRTQER
jgi:ribosomal protein S10